MSKTRLLDEEDVKVITNSEIDEIIGSVPDGSVGGGSIGGGGSGSCDCNCNCDHDGSSGDNDPLPDDYDGIITDDDIDRILNS